MTLPNRGTRAWRNLRARVFKEYADDNGQTWCVYCHTRIATHLDHVIPAKYNGQLVVPACQHCNLSKGASLHYNYRHNWSV